MNYKEGDIVAFAEINKPYSYGKYISQGFNIIYLDVLYENPKGIYNYRKNYSNSVKFKYAKAVKIEDCTIITNKNRIKEIMHLHNKIKVFQK